MNHYLIFDPVEFLGDSKVAIKEALLLSNPSKSKYTILTAHRSSWADSGFCNHQVNLISIPTFADLTHNENGVGYRLKQVTYALLILFVWLRHEKITALIGHSGPSVDLPLYITKKIINIPVIQMIHTPIEKSYCVGYCLTIADRVYYLESVKPCVYLVINHYLRRTLSAVDAHTQSHDLMLGGRYRCFQNGISKEHWPTRAQYDYPTLFWNDSALKCNGLDLLTKAAKELEQFDPFAANICFTRPIDTSLPTCDTPKLLPHVQWHQNPTNVDEIRCQSNIFVSTSPKEYFGFDTLEAIAAGMCVIIPQDGAYWDQALTDGVNCLKYKPGCTDSLIKAISIANQDLELVVRLGDEGLKIAKQHQASNSYRAIVCGLDKPMFTPAPFLLIPTNETR
ncbi:glycosyltransferase [Vibrio sp. ZSDE26]|uniref:Glycosyltransferase n=1 Tax=Vibrio amylolyticus TaxID=2847292 RepID=A0A9X1XMB9_9VIBR|nr:glycosyltransferase [Vibrio amylolyticus]MCK6264945.1 glycosyltransferase [Vibrio amylolyticus]